MRTPLLLAVAALAFLTPSLATAATLPPQVWESTGPEDTPLWFDHQFSQFDSTLGTLNSVTITLNGEILTSFEVTNFNRGNPIDVEGQIDVTYTLENTSFASPDVTFQIQPPAIPLTVGPSGTESVNGLTNNGSNSVVITDPADLLAFIGNGTFTYQLSSEDNSITNGSGSFGGSYLTKGTWRVEVVYDYSPTSVVPEPSSIALLGLGGSALALFRKFPRRRRTAQNA